MVTYFLTGKKELLEALMNDETLAANESLKAGFTDLGLLFNYLTIFNVMPKVINLHNDGS